MITLNHELFKEYNSIDKQMEGSRFSFKFVGCLSISCYKLIEPNGSSYIGSPKRLKYKIFTINPKNVDDKMFSLFLCALATWKHHKETRNFSEMNMFKILNYFLIYIIGHIIVTRNNIVWKLARGYLCYCKTFSLVPGSTECTKNILLKCAVHYLYHLKSNNNKSKEYHQYRKTLLSMIDFV